MRKVLPITLLAAALVGCTLGSATATQTLAPRPAAPSPTLPASAIPATATVQPQTSPLPPTPTPTPPPTPDGVVTRGPYVQSPTSNSIVIVWETDRPLPGEVIYGRGGAYDQRALSSSTGLRHELTLAGLEPGTEYGYWIASSGYPLAEPGSFRTAPTAADPSFTFVTYGDSRSGHATHRLIADRILELKPDFALHTGDLVAYGSQVDEWDRFFDIESALLASVPLFPSPGNHEQNDRRYFEAFVLPGNERWYAFDWGNARIVSLQIDAIMPFGKQSEQVQWLEATLAANTQPWLIVWFHLPPFDAYGKTDLSLAVQTNLLPLFERYGVDLVLNGHSHNYQRLAVNGVLYIVTGGAGAELNPVTTADLELEASYSGHHFVHFTVEGLTLTGRVITTDGTTVDTFTLESGG